MKKPKPKKRYRDAVTGRYVTREYAEANPATTVAETIRKK
jgi:hypothetical protein